MNIVAVLAGAILAALTIIKFRGARYEQKRAPYPVLLATFPLYYFVFAIYASDYSALINELLVSVVFISIAYMAYSLRNFLGMGVLALGYIAHAVYDAIHDSLFINVGSPIWWSEFCGAVDMVIGVYLLLVAKRMYQESALTN